jgi:hypothetical protein
MASLSYFARTLIAIAALSMLAISGCGSSPDASSGTGGTGAAGAAGVPGTAGAGGMAGDAGIGGTGGIGGTAGTGGIDPLPKQQEVLFVGGFMSELYETMSLHLEDSINAALRARARSLNVNIDLPLNQSINIPIGDAIANALPRVSLPLEPGGFISFDSQQAYFDAEGIAYTNIASVPSAFNSIESVANNAAAIFAYLETARDDGKQVVIVSHSKGGLDTLGALLLPGARDLWADTVVGWVALQAPFGGSPVADPAPSIINELLLGALGGNGQSLDDLKSSVRAAELLMHAADIEALTAAIPVISAYSTYEASGTVANFASTFAGSIIDSALFSQITQIVVNNYWATPLDIPGVITRSTTSAVNLIGNRIASALDDAVATVGLMDLTNVYMNSLAGGPNDGLVPSASTVLAGTIHRELPLGDHASPVMDVDPLKNFWPAQERNTITLDLVEEVRSLAGVGDP